MQMKITYSLISSEVNLTHRNPDLTDPKKLEFLLFCLKITSNAGKERFHGKFYHTVIILIYMGHSLKLYLTFFFFLP